MGMCELKEKMQLAAMILFAVLFGSILAWLVSTADAVDGECLEVVEDAVADRTSDCNSGDSADDNFIGVDADFD